MLITLEPSLRCQKKAGVKDFTRICCVTMRLSGLQGWKNGFFIFVYHDLIIFNYEALQYY